MIDQLKAAILFARTSGMNADNRMDEVQGNHPRWVKEDFEREIEYCNRSAQDELNMLHGLWATDKVNLIPKELAPVFFRIGYPNESLPAPEGEKE